jgi:hypothetical protein
VFLVNSRLGHFSATASGYEPYRGTPSPEVTGSICRVPERVFSHGPEDSHPTYLCRFAVRSHDALKPNEAFLGTWGQRLCGPCGPSSHALALTGGFACPPAYTCSTGMPSPVSSTLVRPPMARAGGSGILTGFPSSTPLGLDLGTDLPCADRLDAGNLRLSARGVLTRVLATYADRVDSIRSTRPLGAASLRDGTLSYHRTARRPRIRSFGAWFEPRCIVGARLLDQ